MSSFQSGKAHNEWEALCNSSSTNARQDMQPSHPRLLLLPLYLLLLLPLLLLQESTKSQTRLHYKSALHAPCQTTCHHPCLNQAVLLRLRLSPCTSASLCPPSSFSSSLVSVLKLTSAAAEKDDISPQSASHPETDKQQSWGLLGGF